MGALSIWHWLSIGIVLLALGIPTSIIFKRLGLSRWWTIWACLPYLNVVGLWVLAFVPWPATVKAGTAAEREAARL